MASAADLKFILSGGAANTNPALSLGGAISTDAAAVIKSQAITASTITGVTYDDAAGNSVGAGTMTYTLAGQTLKWTPPAGGIGPAVAVGTNGVYTLYGADTIGHVKVTVVAASLPAGDASQTPTVTHQTNKLFDDVLRSEATAGRVEYRCFYVKNTHAADSMASTLLWVGADTSGVDTLAIGLDPVGVNGVATTIADEATAPVGVTFTAPANELTALSLGTLTFGQYYPVWIRRTVPAASSTTTTADTSRLTLRFL